jgi:hypothetical protein
MECSVIGTVTLNKHLKWQQSLSLEDRKKREAWMEVYQSATVGTEHSFRNNKISPPHKRQYFCWSSDTLKDNSLDNCKIEECYIMGCNSMQFGISSRFFRRNVLPPSSGSKSKPNKQTKSSASCWFLVWFTLHHLIWRWDAPPKRLLSFVGLYGVTAKKTELFMCIHI